MQGFLIICLDDLTPNICANPPISPLTIMYEYSILFSIIDVTGEYLHTTTRVYLRNVERVQYQHVVVVLRESHHVTLGRDFQAAASAHFHIWTLELANKRAVALEDSHMETVAMAVSNEHVASIADVNAIREVCDVLAANTSQELAILVEYNHTVALQHAQVML